MSVEVSVVDDAIHLDSHGDWVTVLSTDDAMLLSGELALAAMKIALQKKKVKSD